MSLKFKGILFDYDGTLARSMEDHFRAWRTVFADEGIKITEADYYPLEGMGSHEVAERLAHIHHLSADQREDLVRRKVARYLETHRPEFYPGVESFVAQLHRMKFPIGIVTGSSRSQLQQTSPASFLSQFDVIVTGEEFRQGKPNPDPYRTAVQKLGLKPQECIAIENAPLGVQSAVNAGTYCIAVCSTVGPETLAGAQEIVPSFADLKQSRAIADILEVKNGSRN